MPDRPRIYVESAPLIDLVKIKVGITTEDKRTKSVFVVEQAMEAARSNDIELYTSVLTIAECTHVNDPVKLDAAKPFFMGLFASGKSGFRLIQTTLSVVERARDLRWFSGIGLSGADSIHVASALHLRCDELWTSDGGILNKSTVLPPLRLRVCWPSDTTNLPSKYLHTPLPF